MFSRIWFPHFLIYARILHLTHDMIAHVVVISSLLSSTSRPMSLHSSSPGQRESSTTNGDAVNRNATNEDAAKKHSQNGKPKKFRKDANKPNAKDFRFLETVKMVKHMFPITINGFAVAKIFEKALEAKKAQAQSPGQTPIGAQDPADASDGKKKRVRLSKKAKEDLICKHIKKIIDRDPNQAIYLSFMMAPEDPEFPFDIESLNFNLAVPPDYGRNPKALPSIIVLNSEIPRGFSINVEKGFAHIASLARTSLVSDDRISLVGRGLLGQVQTLNKHLELFLSQEKRQTMKFVSFKSDRSQSPAPEHRPHGGTQKPSQPQTLFAAANAKPIHASSESQSQRNFQTEELCHKLAGAVKLFNRTAAELRYKVNVPIHSPRGLPLLWTLSDSIDLFLVVPAAYPEVKPRVSTASNFSNNLMVAKKKSLENESLVDVVQEYKRAEANFAANATLCINDSASLLQLLNNISNNLGALTMDKPAFAKWSQMMKELKVDAKEGT